MARPIAPPIAPRCELPGAHGVLTTPWGLVHHHRRGAGSSLALIHDLGSHQGSFAALAARLEGAHHIVALDLLGHGGSDLGADDLSPRAQAEAVREVLEALQLERPVHLVAHGWGGAVAIVLAAMAPELVRKLVLVASGSFPRSPPWVWRGYRSAFVWALLGALGGPRRLRRAWERLGASVVGLSAPMSWRAWRALGRACRQMTADGALQEVEDLLDTAVRAPVLMVWGSDDQVHAASAARATALDLRRPAFVEIAGGSHAVHEERPEVVAELIEEFLAR